MSDQPHVDNRAEILRAYLEGKPIQVKSGHHLSWTDVIGMNAAIGRGYNIQFLPGVQYRIKPETRTLHVHYRIGLFRDAFQSVPQIEVHINQAGDVLPDVSSRLVEWLTPWTQVYREYDADPLPSAPTPPTP